MKSIRGFVACTVAGIGFGALSVRASTVVIDTASSWDQSFGLYSFGPGKTETFGQTLTSPDAAHHFLNNFTVYWAPEGDAYSLSFHVYLYQWTGSTITGAPLFDSGPLTKSVTNIFPYAPVTFDIWGADLKVGNSYVLLATVSNTADYAAGTGSTIWGLRQTDVYSGGTVVWNHSVDNIGALSSNWIALPISDLAFTAQFSDVGAPTPLPAGAMSGGTMILALGLLKLRHRGPCERFRRLIFWPGR